jgi:hypothetical protein
VPAQMHGPDHCFHPRGQPAEQPAGKPNLPAGPSSRKTGRANRALMLDQGHVDKVRIRRPVQCLSSSLGVATGLAPLAGFFGWGTIQRRGRSVRPLTHHTAPRFQREAPRSKVRPAPYSAAVLMTGSIVSRISRER